MFLFQLTVSWNSKEMNSSKFTSVENTVTGHAKEAKPDKQKMDDR